MDNKDNKKKRKKNAAAEEDGNEKGHKKPWTETYATVEEIKTWEQADLERHLTDFLFNKLSKMNKFTSF